VPPAAACTTAVISGKATKDGRPILWKNRDAADIHNQVVYCRDGRYPYLGVVNRGDVAGLQIWAGVNDQGFSIMNNVSYNVETKGEDSAMEGTLMKLALQSCATVVYVITERQGKPHPTRIFDRDLRIDDPYNTYQFPGLPPAPICNPGAVALSAVFNPVNSRYLYFRLVDEASGKHYFSESLDEHIQAAGLAVKPRS